jgi:ribonuclease HI
MPPPSAYHIGYTNGASRWKQNIASVAWALYSPSHDLLHTSGICLGSATNNQVEYTPVIGLFVEANHHHIRHLSVLLYSQLVILQLNNVYCVHDPYLFRKYLQVRCLYRHFGSITFTDIPIQFNQITNNMDNIILYWHISNQDIFTYT